MSTGSKRMKTFEVAERLGLSRETVRGLAASGQLGFHTNSGRIGRGSRKYFDANEVEAFARGGAPAAKAYRESLERPMQQRGRRRQAATA